MSDLGRHPAITVLAADRHPLFLDAVARTIRQDSGMRLVGEECDGRAALAAIRRLAPDVAVVDGTLPQLSGDRVLQAVSRERLRTRILLLSGIVDPGAAYRAVAAGAAGVLSKSVSADQIRRAIRRAAAGRVALCEDTQLGIAEQIRIRARDEPPILSAREQEVLMLVADGMTAPAIARRLQLATSTVRTHIDHLYEKLGASERAQLVAKAMRRGLIE
jgi:two-component system nitrate/nitrite response regulator NarL